MIYVTNISITIIFRNNNNRKSELLATFFIMEPLFLNEFRYIVNTQNYLIILLCTYEFVCFVTITRVLSLRSRSDNACLSVSVREPFRIIEKEQNGKEKKRKYFKNNTKYKKKQKKLKPKIWKKMR